jgi:hypothetical protein
VTHASAKTWAKYFYSIKKVCPWSWEAFQNKQILIIKFDEVLPLHDYQAIVYTFFSEIDIESLDTLAKWCNKTYPECEFLWSHPDHTKGGNNQTPVPVIIQQDRKQLAGLRKGKKNAIDSKTEKTSKSSS